MSTLLKKKILTKYEHFLKNFPLQKKTSPDDHRVKKKIKK